MATTAPDRLAAEARRWLTTSGWHPPTREREQIVERALRALERYYDDVIVVEGIIRRGVWRPE